MSADIASFREVLGARMRSIREDRGLTADEVAAKARRYGLSWQRSTVNTIEAGNRKLTAEELLMLPFLLDVAITDLVKAPVALTERVTMTRRGLTEFLTSSQLTMGGWKVRGFDLAKAFETLTETIQSLPGETPVDVLELAEQDMSQEAEQKAARRLGYSALQISVAAHRLWGRGLTAEREARVAERQSGKGLSLRAVRGHVTRTLDSELRSELKANFPRRKPPHGKR